MRIGGRIWNRRWRLLVDGASAACSQRWRRHKGRLEGFSREYCYSFREEKLFLPKIVKLVVPRPLLEATCIDCADAVVDAIDANFIGSESDNVAMLDVGGVDGSVFFFTESLDEDPER